MHTLICKTKLKWNYKSLPFIYSVFRGANICPMTTDKKQAFWQTLVHLQQRLLMCTVPVKQNQQNAEQ